MIGWKKAKLSDLAIIIMGQSPESKFYNMDWKGLPFFQGCSEFGEFYPRVDKYCSHPIRIAKAGDVLMSVRAPVGKLNIAETDCCIGRGLCAIRPKVNGMFIFYLLKANAKKILAFESGSVFGAINKTDTNNLEFNIPIDEVVQDKIASLLSAYDSLIENNRRRIQLLEQSARLLYREWFVHLSFPGHEHVRIIDGVPEGWEKKQLVNIANLVMGQSPKSEFYNEEGEGLPFHQGVTNFGDRFVNHEFYCTVKNRLANPGDILCSVRAPVGRLNVTLDKIVIGRGLAAIQSKSNHQSFLYYQLKNHFFKEDMIGGGAIFASVTKKDMENQELMYPPKDLVKNFEEISVPIDNQIKTLHIQNERLNSARDILLPRLMNGEIIV